MLPGFIKSGLDLAQGVLKRVAREKASESEQFAHERALVKDASDDATAARAIDAALAKHGRQWPVILALKGMVTPIGGLGALLIHFFNILAPCFGYIKVTLTPTENKINLLIITYFFGYRILGKWLGFGDKK